MKKLLLIDKSQFIHTYFKDKLKTYPVSISSARDGFMGMLSMRKSLPDLIILDSDLPRMNTGEFLEKKGENPNTAPIPVILFSSPTTHSRLKDLSKFNVKEIIQKPLKIDILFETLSRVLNIRIRIDKSPCIIEVHLNEDILFVEIAIGVNTDKIELLYYKISELIDFFHLSKTKMLIFLHDIKKEDLTDELIILLFNTILKTRGADPRFIKIITHYSELQQTLNRYDEFTGMHVTENLEQALKELLEIDIPEFYPDGKKIIKEDFVHNPQIQGKNEGNFILKFGQEEIDVYKKQFKQCGVLSIAVVDDDEYIREFISVVFSEFGWQVKQFADGKTFIKNTDTNDFDLVFLDIKMPDMDGFQVIQILKKNKIIIPIVILSALSRKKTILKALSLGIKNYIIKPVTIEYLLARTSIIMGHCF